MFLRLVPFFILFLNLIPVFGQAVCDTTVDISSTANANGTGQSTLNPYNPTNLNAYIASRNASNCASLSLELAFDDLPEDTVYFSDTLKLNPGGRIAVDFSILNLADPTTRLYMKSANSGSPLANIIYSNAPKTTINNIGFVQENGSGYAINLQSEADSSFITNCVFNLVDGGAINLAGDSVLIERNFFRNISGTYAYVFNNSGRKVELRSNLFLSGGVQSNSHGIHILANTFVGEADNYIISLSDLTSPDNDNFKIQHNLIAVDGWLFPPLNTQHTDTQDSVVRNAYFASSGVPMNQANGVPSADNVLLPPGLSDYDNADYPLVQFHTDASLPIDGSDFGYVSEVYRNFTDVIPPLSDLPGTELSFINFLPYDKSATAVPNWDGNMLVGCLPEFDPNGTIYKPSPIASLSFSSDGFNVSQSAISYDTSYYGNEQTLGLEMFYFLSDTENMIGADTATLIGNGYYWNGVAYSKDGIGIGQPNEAVTSIKVPNSLRTGGPVYVKMVHKNANGFAHVVDSVAIVEVTGVDAYPVRDFQLNLSSNATQHQLGIVQFSFVAGVEEIDSIGVLIFRGEDSTVYKDTAYDVSGLTQLTFDDLPQRDSVLFKAYPIGTSSERGTDTLETEWIKLNELTSELVYVSPSSSCLPNAKGLGTEDQPFCDITDGLSEAASRPITLVVDFADSNPEDVENLTIDNSYGADELIIMSRNYLESNSDLRPIMRGITITRPNTQLVGFLLEKIDEATPAVTLGANQVTLDANILRFQTENEVAGDIIRISGTSATDSLTISNNVVFNGTAALKFAGPGFVKVLNNTFIDKDSVSIALSQDPSVTTGLNVIVASNHFSGNGVAHGAPFSNTLSSSMFQLQRNVFASSEPELFDLTNPAPRLLPGPEILSVRTHNPTDPSLFISTFVESKLETALSCKLDEECSSLNFGASPSYPVARDLFGRVRKAPNDVGALEDRYDSAWTSGRISVSTIENEADSVTIDFTSLNYDTTTYKYLYIWYSKGELENTIPPISEAINQNQIDVSTLGPGGLGGLQLTLGASGLDSNGNITYTACQAFGTAANGPNAHAGCVEFTTPNVIKEGGCSGAVPGQRCPENLDSWGFTDNLYGTVKTYYTWEKASQNVVANPVSGGSIDAGIKASIPQLQLYDSLPYINADFSYQTTDPTEAENNFFKINFELPSTAVIPSDLQVYRVTTSNRIFYVPSWSVEVNGLVSTVSIHSREQGRFYFTRGAQVATPGGTLSLESLETAIDTGTNLVDINLTGAQFITSNPFIAVAALPAGSMADDIFDPDYFSKFQIFNTSLGSLGSELQGNWTFNYFNAFREALSTGTLASGFGKIPVDFTVDEETFTAAMAVKGLGSVVEATTGDIPSTSLSVNIKNGDNVYAKTRTQRKVTRGLEFMVAVFDAGKVSFSRVVAPVSFGSSTENALQQSSGGEIAGTDEAVFADVVIKQAKTWELFSYPWAEDVDAEDMMLNAIGSTANKWDKYNQKIARWDGSKYVEYDGNSTDGFQLDKGKAIWVAVVDKSKNYFTPRSNGGQTLDHQLQSLSLISGVWNDFGIPYNFPINLGDLRAASGNYAGEIWEYSPEEKSWIQLVSDTTSLFPWKGYTTLPPAPQTLIFPNIDNQRSDNPALSKRRKSAHKYQLAVDVYNSSATQHIFIGQGLNEKTMGKAPLVPGQNFSAYITANMEENKEYSYSVKKFEGNMNSLWPLHIDFQKGSDLVQVKKSNWAGPDSLQSFIWDAKTNKIFSLSENPVLLKKSQIESGEFYLAVGNSEFAESLKSLNAHQFVNFPNPFTSITQFKYSLPPVSNLGQVPYELTIRDLRGKVLRQFKGNLAEGKNELLVSWDGNNSQGKTMPAGSYLVQIQIRMGAESLSANRKVIKIH